MRSQIEKKNQYFNCGITNIKIKRKLRVSILNCFAGRKRS